jgi:hypothetical protein
MKAQKVFFIGLFTVIIHFASAQEVFISPKLEKVWETPAGLNIPESSHFNVNDKIIYVSNIVGKHNVKDGIGYISKVNTKGQFIQKEWFKGLNAPKGIWCSNTRLYVTDIDRLVEIDLKTAKLIHEYRSSKSKSLNDVTVADNGKVYVSDSEGNCVFVKGTDSLQVLVEGADFKSMNGILASGNEVVLGCAGNLIAVNQITKKVTILAAKTGYVDGLVQIGKGRFITSDWSGKVQLVEVGKGIEKLLDGTAAKINAADLGYIPDLKLLLVPTFQKNTVVAYRLKL